MTVFSAGWLTEALVLFGACSRCLVAEIDLCCQTEKLNFMSSDQNKLLKIGIIQTILAPIVYVVFGLVGNLSMTDSLLSSVGAVVACWIVIGFLFIGSKNPKK